MKIEIDNISKRYSSGWVIKDLSFLISSKDKISIKGLNGSGKSTLIQMLSGYLSCSKGKINYSIQGENIKRDDIYKYCSIVAAYSELDEELTVEEIFLHYKRFKPFLISDLEEFINLVDLKEDRYKAIKDFSSGMKQRLNLALGITMDVPLLILDEPSSFLDDQRKDWMLKLINDYASEKTIIVASNDPVDFSMCNKEIKL